MGYSSYRITRLNNRLININKALEVLDKTYLEASSSGVNSYTFDSGEGSQRTNRRSLEEISREIRELEAEANHVENELAGYGLINMRLRRKSN